MKAAQVLVGIVKYHMMFRQIAHFVEVLLTLQKNVSKEQESKRKKLVRLMFQTIHEGNIRLGNALDVDLRITQLQNFLSHQKIT